MVYWQLAVNLLLLTLQPYLGFVFCTGLSQDFVSLMSWLQFHSFSFFKSNITTSLHLFFGRPLVLTPIGFHSAIFLTSFISSFMLRCPHHFILCAFVYWTLCAPFICSSLLLLILHPYTELIQISSLIFVFQKVINYLCPIQTVSRFCMHMSLLALLVSCRCFF